MAGRQELRAHLMCAQLAQDSPDALSRQHVQGEALGQNLLGLPAQRPHGHSRRSALAASPRRRSGVHAARMAGREEGPGSQGLHGKDRARAPAQERCLEGLRGVRPIPQRGDPKAHASSGPPKRLRALRFVRPCCARGRGGRGRLGGEAATLQCKVPILTAPDATPPDKRTERLNTKAAGVIGLAVMCSRLLGLAREQASRRSLARAGVDGCVHLRRSASPNLFARSFRRGRSLDGVRDDFFRRSNHEGKAMWGMRGSLANKVATLTAVLMLGVC